MEYRVLGRTGLQVSTMGLGCGGPSRIGLATGKSEAEQVRLVQQALDAGVNFLDTAEAYHTEEIVGKAIQGRSRESVVLSTKKSVSAEPLTPQKLREGLEASLRRLGVETVDVYHMHGITAERYESLVEEVAPTLQELQTQGKIRFIGITEHFSSDPTHAMLQRAVQDDLWDVMMVGFNLLNQSARERILAPAQQKAIGMLVMFAVRRALSQPARLHEVIQTLVERGEIDPAAIDAGDPLGFLIHEGGAASLPDAAYRFCRDEPGVHVVLAGTGNPDHLAENIASFGRPPLSPASLQRVKDLFRGVESVSGS
jgi:aryl-alcohol dehydrogenase-like predicted oxidoreductase